MSACYAFTKKDKPCRNYACIKSQTDATINYGYFCRSHEHLERDKDKLWQMIIDNCENLDYNPENRRRIRALLNSGLIKVSKEMLRLRLPLVLRARDFALFFCYVLQATPDFKRDWCPTLWKRCVVILWNWSRAMGPLLIDWEHVQAAICLREDPLAFYDGMAWRISPMAEQYTPELWQQFFWNSVRNRPDWFAAFTAKDYNAHQKEWTECILKSEANHVVEEKLKTIFQIPVLERTPDFWRWIAQCKQERKQELRQQVGRFKERLMAATWHTNRFVRWCLDEDEKAENRRLWPEVEPNNPLHYQFSDN